jgi:hypothetical protein
MTPDILVRRHEIHGTELSSDSPAHELVNWRLQELAQRIPTSHVEAADDEARRPLEGVPTGAHDLGDDAFGIEGRLADIGVFHLVENRLDHPGIGAHADHHLADTRDSSIGVNFDQSNCVAIPQAPGPTVPAVSSVC